MTITLAMPEHLPPNAMSFRQLTPAGMELFQLFVAVAAVYTGHLPVRTEAGGHDAATDAGGQQPDAGDMDELLGIDTSRRQRYSGVVLAEVLLSEGDHRPQGVRLRLSASHVRPLGPVCVGRS
jgi:hypothetical protein